MALSIIIERNIKELNSSEKFDYFFFFSMIILSICLVFITWIDVEIVRTAVISLRQLAVVEMERAKLE